ncbi:hypothetical protein MN608_04381 [Microdochium nivale]|nr:hypothetical protein MN608_04381 [Microdochium nivale]
MSQHKDNENGCVQEDLLRHVGTWYDVDNADSMTESPWDLLQAEVFQVPYYHATQEQSVGQYHAEASDEPVSTKEKTKNKSKKDAAKNQ